MLHDLAPGRENRDHIDLAVVPQRAAIAPHQIGRFERIRIAHIERHGIAQVASRQRRQDQGAAQCQVGGHFDCREPCGAQPPGIGFQLPASQPQGLAAPGLQQPDRQLRRDPGQCRMVVQLPQGRAHHPDEFAQLEIGLLDGWGGCVVHEDPT